MCRGINPEFLECRARGCGVRKQVPYKGIIYAERVWTTSRSIRIINMHEIPHK
jgi:hypothetical protein